jgi:competence protein ComEC
VAAAHFNQIAQYGLLANLLSVPLMGVLVIPAAVLAALLLPLGLDGLPLWAMGQGLGWILAVAERVAALEGARVPVVTPGPWVLPLMALGALTVVLWQGRARAFGLVPVFAAFWLWSEAERPRLLVSDTGALVGVMTAEGRALNKSRGAGFVAGNWLENDGDTIDQPRAHDRWREDLLAPLGIVLVTGKAAARVPRSCDGATLLIYSADPDHPPSGPCRVITPATLRQTGALALVEKAGALHLESAADVAGRRLWSPQ